MTNPIGVTNNNPLNIRPLPAPRLWDGQTGSADSPAGEFCTFKSVAYGFRAAMKNLQAYVAQGLDTPRKIINTWAPPSDNNPTSAYLQAVCDHTKFTPDQVLNLRTYDDASSLLYAMTIQEQGSFDKFFKPWQLNAGLTLAGVGDVPKSGLHAAIAAVGSTAALAGANAADIQSGLASIGTPIASVPSPTMQMIYHGIMVLGALIGAYGLVHRLRSGGSSNSAPAQAAQ